MEIVILIIILILITYYLYRRDRGTNIEKNKVENQTINVDVSYKIDEGILEKVKEFERTIFGLKKQYIDRRQFLILNEDYADLYDEVKKISIKLKNKHLEVQSFEAVYFNLEKWVEESNESFFKKEAVDAKELFMNVGRQGINLDTQQQIAVMTNEENALVLAGAGSGKTLTISAKVRYLVNRLNVNPSEILLISFTKASAEEMTERIRSKLGIQIDAKTFHKLGLDLIRSHSTKSINIAPEDALTSIIYRYFREVILENPEKLLEVVKFYSVYLAIPKNLEDYETFGEYIEDESTYDMETIKSKVLNAENRLKVDYRTLNMEKVKSIEEVIIANFLYLNGIEYEYERPYPFREENQFSQYKPDFYLPEYDIYLEHFGITSDYKVPWLNKTKEKEYIDGIHWKRQMHSKFNTRLLETYSYYNKSGILLKKLELILKRSGVQLKPIDLRLVYEKIALREREEQQFREFKKLIATFITLFKSNGYDSVDISKMYDNLSSEKNLFLRDRTKLFLKIVRPIYEMYQEYLNSSNLIDFNDMIIEATRLVRNNKPNLPYQYIIIDEFQDISMGRYQLVKEFKKLSNSKIFAVGDDWQSIYRFTGSDLQLFVNFESYFGYTKLLKIEQTYRNSQQLIDIASKFVLKNPLQLKKNLRSAKSKMSPVKIFGYVDDVMGAFEATVQDILKNHPESKEIMVISRNNTDFKFLFDKDDDHRFTYKEKPTHQLTSKYYPNVKFQLNTAHKSKGLEAENVIVVNMRNHLIGFPNKISDDPVLSLVLTNGDTFPYAEERRTFYVAITRTKNNTYLIAPEKDASLFVTELAKEQSIPFKVVTIEETTMQNPKCPYCQTGHLILRKTKDTNKYFLGCSNYPGCSQTYKQIDILKNPLKCTSCGSYMVKREGKFGQFYGCADYPRCKNTINIK